MGKSKIEWTTDTWNPVTGCSIVSPGCTNCYAMKMAARLERMGQDQYSDLTKPSKVGAVWTGKMRFVESTLVQPLRWKKPRHVFVNSMSDLFHEDALDEWIDQVFAVMALARQHTFQILTKRPERMLQYMGADPWNGWGGPRACKIFDKIRELASTEAEGHIGVGRCISGPLPNVWLGVSAERQQEADHRIPYLLLTPAAVRFVSCEPLLGPVDLTTITEDDTRLVFDALRGDPQIGQPNKLDWVIVGGESGRRARPMHPDWARSIRDQCAAAGVPFFFKQQGEWGAGAYNMRTKLPVIREFMTWQEWVNKAPTWVNGGTCVDTAGNILTCGGDFAAARDADRFPVAILHKIGKKDAGRILDDRTWDQMPEVRP